MIVLYDDGYLAAFSHCKQYRWILRRIWGDAGGPRLGWIMLNPSTADARKDDKTIGQCVKFARRWGFDGIEVCNLYALRSTNPLRLKNHSNPVGDGADMFIRGMIERCPHVVAGWGAFGGCEPRIEQMVYSCQIRRLWCLGTTKGGNPRHPLYVPGNQWPIPFMNL